MQQQEDFGKHIFRVKLLGGFSLSDGEHAVCDSINRTKRLWSLLEYLIVFRKREVSQSDLVKVLWAGADCENPSGALKNLVYRLRIIFEQYALRNARDIIVFQNGSYRLNGELPFVVDIEEFERLAILGRDLSMPNDKRAEYYSRALSYHEGEFLPNSNCEIWTVALRERMKALYLECVYFMCTFLGRHKKYSEMHDLCAAAAALYPFEERVQKYMIYALSKGNRSQEALERYRHVTDLFYRELGVKPSASMQQLYLEIIKSLNPEESDLSSIKMQLHETLRTQSAYYCEYEVFKNIYRIQMRSKERTGLSFFIALITALVEPPQGLDPARLGMMMDSLLQSAQGSLRSGDIVARYSQTQYVLMLGALTYENGMAVLRRIEKKFKADRRFHFLDLKCELQPVEAAMDMDAQGEGET